MQRPEKYVSIIGKTLQHKIFSAIKFIHNDIPSQDSIMEGDDSMSWFRNLKTRSKIMLLVGTLLFLLVAIAFIGYRTNMNMEKDMEALYDDYASPAIYILRAQVRVQQVRDKVVESLLATDTDSTSSLGEITRLRGEVETFTKSYTQSNMSDEEKTVLARLQSASAKVRPIHDAVLEMGIKNRDAEGYAYITSPAVVQLEAEYYESYADLVQLLVDLADKTKETSMETALASTRVSIGISIAALVIGALFGVFVAKTITNPILSLRKGVEQFSQGDLSVSLDSQGLDEIAEMGHTLQEMSGVLNRVIGSVNDAGRNIAETAHEFSAMAQETNASVEEFRANIDEMGINLDSLASAGQEVNASIEEVAAGAQATAERGTDTARKVDEAMTAGESGMNAVRRVVQSIGGVAESSSETTSAVVELGNRARQIQGFVTQIGGIADQTNLLALNAAIEAARAGEAGRGFAVVAEEVRKLAEDSNVAAKNIADLASTITRELDAIVSAAQSNASDSGNARELSVETEAAIEKMIDYLQSIASSTQDLAAVSEQQAASSEGIAETIQNMASKINSTAGAGENIRNSVSEVAAAAERVALGAESLASLSGELQEELSFFRLAGAREYNPSRADRLRALPN